MPAVRQLLVVQVAVGLVAGLLAWGLAGASAPEHVGRFAVRQKPKDEKSKKKRQEEEDDRPAKADKKAEEKAPPARDKPRKRGEEEDEKPVKPGVGRLDEEAEKQAPSRAVTGDLATAAKAAKNSKLQRLYRVLSVEHDELVLKRARGVLVEGTAATGRLRIRPLPEYIADPDELKEMISFVPLNDAGEEIKGKDQVVGPGRIATIRYYEQIAVDEVKEFLQQRFTNRAPSSDEYLSRWDQLAAAEFALSHVLRFHQSARETGLRKGDAWEVVERPLRLCLLEVLLEQMTELKENKNFNAAFDLARKVTSTFTRPGDHKLIAGPLADLLRVALKDAAFSQEQLKEARVRLKFLEDQFPDSDLLRPIRDSLQAQAKVHFDRAKDLYQQAQEKEKEEKGSGRKLTTDARAALSQAEELWPELPGLRTFRIQIDQEYQVLKVGVRSLPTYLSPGWACTDSELRAVELLFESLVSLTPDEKGCMYYRPVLAEGRPVVLRLGREFKLPRNAKWSDDGALGAGDLRFTLRLLKDGKLTGRSPAWGELLRDMHVRGDPFRVQIRLRQGLIEPLAAMSFKLLPARGGAKDPTKREFALAPVSSGPFQYQGRTSDPETNRLCASFAANPYYGVRPNKLNLPRIREVRLYPVLDAVKDLQGNKPTLDLALDLTAEQAAALRGNPDLEVPLPTARTANRRIYFLAVNNHHPALANPEVRIALARAIHREQLLDEHFRKGLGRQVHKSLNGPYPAGSWACDPRLVSRSDKASLDPYDPDLARAKLNEGLEKLGKKELQLTVKYPTGDQVLEAAMRALCEQVSKELPGVTLTPQARPPHELREEVEETYKYDLAYYHHDFVDETFWLMPLLGPVGRGGAENFLRYTGSLVAKIQAADTLRHFSQVCDHVHAIHRQFLEGEMPMVPLWQLDPLYAYRKGVLELPGVLDPQQVFTRVEEWRVRRKNDG